MRKVLKFSVLSIVTVTVLAFLISSCDRNSANKNGSGDSTAIQMDMDFTGEPIAFDLQQILDRDTLIAITGYSSTSYFIYRGMPMGYEYELLQRLATDLGVELKIVIAKNMDEVFFMLNRGVGDIVAYNMTVTLDRQKIINFTAPHSTTKQVLVQKLPDSWQKMKRHEIDKMLIRDVLDLIGKEVYVRKNSAYHQRLINLSNEIGGEILIKTVPGDKATDEIIKMVHDGIIPRTVSDNNIALLNRTYLRGIDIETNLSFSQRVAWAVRKNSPELLDAVNDWIHKIHGTNDYYTIYNKYFKNLRRQKDLFKSQYYSKKGGKISKYDALIQEQAKRIGWDWRLLASQVYQESKFNPLAKSWAGAKGLMQLMPATGKKFRVKNPVDPAQNLKAGTSYLKWLENYWAEIPDSLERIKFMLGSYNVGQGHVQDARRLTEKAGKDPRLWEDVSIYLGLKSNEKYFNDPAVYYGYCRGDEPVNYVKEIFNRYREYQQFFQ